ncbi:hypothetical protein EVAR_83975_1 [Eumeta japonica]|uniref:Uncharacterized protein n=1 Tax=Eumeta variegata TaxID=151549 RepID=A0A4C1VR43_EUMVA|nr:hypothetical protein EVAR_83975_1 [Eumeta japonica]
MDKYGVCECVHREVTAVSISRVLTERAASRGSRATQIVGRLRRASPEANARAAASVPRPEPSIVGFRRRSKAPKYVCRAHSRRFQGSASPWLGFAARGCLGLENLQTEAASRGKCTATNVRGCLARRLAQSVRGYLVFLLVIRLL